MAENKTTDDIIAFYMKQCQETTRNVLIKICEPNGISLQPTAPSQLCPIPVYESEFPVNFFSIANDKGRTTLAWPIGEFQFLQAYIKRYRGDDGRIRNEIVVNASNYCWARFYAAKELMHCMTDEDGYSACGSIDLVNELIESLVTGGIIGAKPKTIVDEVAWFGACGLLVPDPWIQMIRKAQNVIRATLPDVDANLHLAQILRVPVLVLNHRLKHAT